MSTKGWEASLHFVKYVQNNCTYEITHMADHKNKTTTEDTIHADQANLVR